MILVESSPSDTAGAALHAGYAFDVTNERYVAGYADNVFVGRVEAVAAADRDGTRTLYDVTVLDALKGSLGVRVQVSQLGYLDEDGVPHVIEDQPLLEPGSTYVLAPSDEPDGEQTLIGGPVASVEVDDPRARAEAVTRYAAAVRNQMFPPGVSR